MAEESWDESAYGEFAGCYDLFMDNIPYDAWAEYLDGILKRYGIAQGTLAELGCGTGNMTRRMADRGYEIIGLDSSEEMLMMAGDKEIPHAVLVHQDMREMELPVCVDAMYCVCDGMNYLLKPQDLRSVFVRAGRYLEAGGIFVFDMKTRHFFRDILGERVIAENREDASFIWENEYDAQTGIHTYFLTIYQREDREDDLYARYEEVHRQRAYEISEIESLLCRTGFQCCGVYEALTDKAPGEESERVYFVAQKA